VSDLIALAKGKPGALNYGAPGAGSSTHLAAELFKSMAGVNIVFVPYKGTGPALTGLLGAEVQLSFGSATSVTPHIQSGKLRAIAVTTAQPSALAPGVPTVADSGLPGYEFASNYTMLLPAGTPPGIVTLLYREIVHVLNMPDTKERVFGSGAEIVGSTPDEFSAQMKSEIARISKLIQDGGLHAE
jgi:tripartite-type tricarboxylate transporter receptor subunit TctC